MQLGNMKNYSPGAIANCFLKKSWDQRYALTSVHLQKLVYFANGWHMAFNNNEDEVLPLINEPFQAWEYGPVCASIYHEFKGFGSNPISKNYLMREIIILKNSSGFKIEPSDISSTDKKTTNLLEEVWEKYSKFEAFQLSAMTHFDDPDNPWRKAIESAKQEGIVRGKEISSKDIKNYFRKLLKEQRAY